MDSFQYDLAGRIQHTKLDTGIGSMPSARLDRIENQSSPDLISIYTSKIQ